MADTTSPVTFQDLYLDVIRRARANETDEDTLAAAKALINEGLQDIHVDYNWPWAERRGTIVTHPTYSVGTVTIGVGVSRANVIGSLAPDPIFWLSTVPGYPGMTNARAGGKMVIAGSAEPYVVASVNDDRGITLESPWIGDDVIDGTYLYYEDEYALAPDFARLIDAQMFSTAVVVMDRQEWYRTIPGRTSRGRPHTCTIIELAPLNDAPQHRVVLYPAPSATFNIPYRYITSHYATDAAGTPQVSMVADTDVPIIPIRYRAAIVRYALKEWYRDRKDDARFQPAEAAYVEAIGRMSSDTGIDRDKLRLVARRRSNRGPMISRHRMSNPYFDYPGTRVH